MTTRSRLDKIEKMSKIIEPQNQPDQIWFVSPDGEKEMLFCDFTEINREKREKRKIKIKQKKKNQGIDFNRQSEQ